MYRDVRVWYEDNALAPSIAFPVADTDQQLKSMIMTSCTALVNADYSKIVPHNLQIFTLSH